MLARDRLARPWLLLDRRVVAKILLSVVQVLWEHDMCNSQMQAYKWLRYLKFLVSTMSSCTVSRSGQIYEQCERTYQLQKPHVATRPDPS